MTAQTKSGSVEDMGRAQKTDGLSPLGVLLAMIITGVLAIALASLGPGPGAVPLPVARDACASLGLSPIAVGSNTCLCGGYGIIREIRFIPR